MEPWTWVACVAAAGAAGWVDAIAGGGGLLTVPTLLAVGVPPHEALGTNKLQAVLGSGTAALQYSRAGLVKPRSCLPGMLLAGAAAAGGALAVQALEADPLRKLIPLLLLLATLGTALRPRFGLHPRPQRRVLPKFELLAAVLLGFYDGFFGPGTGTFWAAALVSGAGLDLSAATARTKFMNFASNAGALVVFAAGGALHVSLGLSMGLAQACGARLGACMAARHGPRFIRPVFLAVVVALILRLGWDAWRPAPAGDATVSPSPPSARAGS
ncbi:MAG: UPF0721 transmembrane protein [Limisphaera sp.]|nr:MAG: UPF0721 transmembrane protein [Limisphaera sp.]